jgi:predicted  nucleic acid-binding Zn ribbon protein
MIARLSFNLNDEGDKYRFNCAIKGHNMKSVIDDLDQKLRSITKYEADEYNKMNGIEMAQMIRDNLHELINEYDARVDE